MIEPSAQGSKLSPGRWYTRGERRTRRVVGVDLVHNDSGGG